MKLKPSLGTVFHGASIFAGVMALAELIFIFLPKIRPLGGLLELLELYVEAINPAFKGMIGDSFVAQMTLAAVLVWISTYTALESFSRQTDGLSLWQNIAHDSCGRVPAGFKKTACTVRKWLMTFAFAPMLVLWAIIVWQRTGATTVTVGFISVTPAVIMKYLKHLGISLAAIVSLAAFVGGSGLLTPSAEPKAIQT